MTHCVPPTVTPKNSNLLFEVVMKAVIGADHLFIRKNVYYFRYKLRNLFYKKDIRLSLKTSKLELALHSMEELSPFINTLKSLPIILRYSDRLVIEKVTKSVILNMKKVLETQDIDRIIKEEEASFIQHHKRLMQASRISVDEELSSESYFPVISDDTRYAFSLLCERHESLNDLLANENFEGKPELLGLVLACVKLSVLKSTRSLEQIFQDETMDQEVRLMAHQIFTEQFKNESTKSSSLKSAETLFNFKYSELGVSRTEINRLVSQYGYQPPNSDEDYRVFHEKLKESRQLLKRYSLTTINKDIVSSREIEALVERERSHVANDEKSLNNNVGKLFSEVYTEFLEHKIVKEKLSNKIQQDYERFYEVWQLLTNDKDITKYEPKDIGLFIDQCFDLPKMNVAPFNKMSMSERISADVPEDKRIAPKSVQGYYKWLQSVFAYASRDTVSYIKRSPCNIKRDFTQNKRGPFTDSELRLLQQYALAESVSWKKWCILLAIYTGARRGELFQLKVEDIKIDSDSSLYYILISDEHEGQKIKTENARRRIPLHPKLIEFGILDMLTQSTGRLLQGVDNRNSITAWFGRIMAKLGIESANELSHTRSFHSFRHSFISKIRNESPSLDLHLLQQVVGHELSRGGITDNYTHRTAPLKQLQRVVNMYLI